MVVELPKTQVDIAIIGAGIIGLATGVKLLEKNPRLNVVIIEKEPSVAAHQTGHNSGVIHSGIYYRPGSLKANNCRKGVSELLSFCETHDVPYDLCGKVIVATEEKELPRLLDLYERGKSNGVPDLRLINQVELNELEPHVRGIKAIHSPSTGVVDYTRVAEAMKNVIVSFGGQILFNTKVIDLEGRSDGCIIQTDQGEVQAKLVVNCSGLYSDRIAASVVENAGIKIIPFRGEYYTLTKAASEKVRTLIYPVPDPKFPFLGVHFTRGIDGEVEAGPNAVLALAREGYRKTDINLKDLFDTLIYPGFWKLVGSYWKTGTAEQIRSFIKPLFVKALQRIIPEINSSDLQTGGAGIRAQALLRNGKLVDDFFIVESENSIHVLNAPSPAATASLAIGEHIADIAAKRFTA
ncbi:MAG: L-2-hydroxyglutarate oxidase [Candidatus Marinimicrobia bacterium]|nr:L-2-hydroxyglutarate oxidase [Candidatus Neomarinimicrobiota bacterium]